MKITLADINESNWRECAFLEVSEDQKNFIQSNLYSIAEAKYDPGMKLYGIYLGDLMIGFASYILDSQGDMNLYKLMIDRKYQGKGYGTQALTLLMELIKREAVKREIWLSLHPDNAAAIKLYTSYGFHREEIELDAEDEIFYKYEY